MNSSDNSARPSVRSLAHITGLSVATISRVLNNSGRVSETTRLRVQQAMQESGYVPNSAARALSTSRTRTIGAILPTLSASIFARFTEALEAQLATHNYSLVVATSRYNPVQEAQRARALITMGAEALVFSGAQQTQELLTLLGNAQIPAICSSVHETGNGLAAVGYDNARIASAAIEYLNSLGHKHIGVVHGSMSDNDRTQLRVAGIKQAARHCDVNTDFFETTLDVAGGVSVANHLLGANRTYTAVLCLSDVIAQGILFASNQQGIKIPDQLSLMGFDDLDWAAHSHPALTTIRLPTARMGRTIANALVQRLENNDKIESQLLDASIVPRASTGKPF